MPELKDMSRDDWEDADVDVGSILVFVPFHCSPSPLPAVGCLRIVITQTLGGITIRYNCR